MVVAICIFAALLAGGLAAAGKWLSDGLKKWKERNKK